MRCRTNVLQKLKRFCCSSCPYRSNFRSDVVRHVRHKHPAVAASCAGAGVSKLDAASAAATLADYVNTWAPKKFVPRSHHRCRRPSSPPGTSTTDSSRPRCGARSVSPPSGIGDARSATPDRGGAESQRSFASEDRLVIDVVSSDERDEKCAADLERDQPVTPVM